MAKKKKEIIIIDTRPLMPTKLGLLEEKTSGGPVFTIFLCIIFLAFIIGLPYITEYIGGKAKGITSIIAPKEDEVEKKKEDVDTNTEEEVRYDIKVDSSVVLGDLTFTNFKLGEDKTITFTATNKSNQSINLSNTKYYFELYSDNTYLSRYLLTNNSNSIKTSSNFSFDVSNSYKVGSPNKIMFKVLDEGDYPIIVLKSEVKDKYYFVCTNNNYEFEYAFKKNNKAFNLTDITRRITLNENDSTYINSYESLEREFKNYNKVDGINTSSTKNLNNNIFSLSVSLGDITSADYKNLLSDKVGFYKNSTSVNVVGFEMEAQGYECEEAKDME